MIEATEPKVMESKLKLPLWALEKNIYILSGIELVAYKIWNESHWMVKTVRCNVCGKCCMKLPEAQMAPIIEGRCMYLTEQDDGRWSCQLDFHRPIACSVVTFNGRHAVREVSECVERFEEQ